LIRSSSPACRIAPTDGVHFEGVRFLAAELNGLVGERV